MGYPVAQLRGTSGTGADLSHRLVVDPLDVPTLPPGEIC